ncbi:MAG TPA: hypothetical protein GX008_04600 [Firmicutes bacterium]|nr:hypothetical protein [Bacillota bacterium]
MRFEVRFRLAISTGPAGEYLVTPEVASEGQHYFTTGIEWSAGGLFPQW